MKFSLALAITTFAAGVAAQQAYYSKDLNQTCTLGNNGEMANCVEGMTDGAIDAQTSFADVLIEGQPVPRSNLAERGYTCGWFGTVGCKAKCHLIHGKSCGGRCSDSWCYCSASC